MNIDSFFEENMTKNEKMICHNKLGDIMKKVYLIPVVLSIAIGFIIGKTMCDEYHTTSETKSVFQTTNSLKVYYLQYGVYSNEESMKNSVLSLPYYIYRIEENQYHVYIGVTSKEENVAKMQEYFNSFGYVTYKKEGYIKNQEYMEQLHTLDEMLTKVTDQKTINDINQKILENYKED